MGTFIVGGILFVILFLIVRSLVQRLKSGHGFCTYGDCKSCGHCASSTNNADSQQCTGNCTSCGKCSSQKKKRP